MGEFPVISHARHNLQSIYAVQIIITTTEQKWLFVENAGKQGVRFPPTQRWDARRETCAVEMDEERFYSCDISLGADVTQTNGPDSRFRANFVRAEARAQHRASLKILETFHVSASFLCSRFTILFREKIKSTIRGRNWKFPLGRFLKSLGRCRRICRVHLS